MGSHPCTLYCQFEKKIQHTWKFRHENTKLSSGLNHKKLSRNTKRDFAYYLISSSYASGHNWRNWAFAKNWNQYDVIAATVTELWLHLYKEHGRQCMPCSINFSVTLQTEILFTVTSDFLKQMIILKSFNSVLTLKAPITTAADDIHKYFFIVSQRK